MERRDTYPIFLASPREQDRDYIREVCETVYASYSGGADRWQLVDTPQIWQISFGGRAGVVGVRVHGRVSCAKLFYDKRLRNPLRVALGLGKGRRAYRNGVRLGQLGVKCPQMWGYAERRPWGPGMIVTELIQDGKRLDHWIAEHGTSSALACALGRTLRDMHDKGVSHLDLSPRNILVRRCGDSFDFLLLDYEDARFSRQVSRRRRLENLHHLHERMIRLASVRERLRFLRAYAPPDYRAWRDTLRRMLDWPR